MIGDNWPVYAGESFDLWNPDTCKYYASIDPVVATDHLYAKRHKQANVKSSAFYGRSQTEINDPDTLPCLRARIAFRKITRATDPRTIFACLLPPKVVIADHAPYLLWEEAASPPDEAYLLGVLSSMICDWYARRVVSLNLTFHLFNNIPIPNPADTPQTRELADRVVKIAGTLAAVDDRFDDWAAEVGVPVGTATDDNPEYKQALIEELDACVALLYGLDEDDLACLYETFHETTDYSDRHQAVLAHFRRLATLPDDSISPDES